ncbi:MAG: hypothetical protein KDD47_26775, partial [Acidobacteria bacterium]|nr:hypothetical protein [Acidobacteriota bacterium]
MTAARFGLVFFALFVSNPLTPAAWGQGLGGGGLGAATVEMVGINTAGRGAEGVEPGGLLLFGGQLFFSGESAMGRELWVSDGTAGGTQVFADLMPGALGSQPQELVAAGSRFFFRAWDEAHGYELWTSDGTAGGTSRVTDGAPGAASFTPQLLTHLGSDLFYSATEDDQHYRLWKTD